MNSTLIQTDRFTLSETERSAIEHELHHYEDPRAASIEALKIVQKERGWVPDGALYAIGEILGIPASDVEGVATFYSQIFRQPVGRHIIRVCDSMVCYIGGHESVVSEIQNKLGIGLGQTTPDGRFTAMMPHPERVQRNAQMSWTKVRALRNMRIHGDSSPYDSGAHECTTPRNTRSACGIRTVKRPSSVVTEVRPPGEPFGLNG